MKQKTIDPEELARREEISMLIECILEINGKDWKDILPEDNDNLSSRQLQTIYDIQLTSLMHYKGDDVRQQMHKDLTTLETLMRQRKKLLATLDKEEGLQLKEWIENSGRINAINVRIESIADHYKQARNSRYIYCTKR